MKNHSNFNYHKILLLFAALSLSACDGSEDISSSEYRGRINAKYVRPEAYAEYLNCYALNKAAKRQCIDRLTEKYIDEKLHADEEYITALQFEAEKIGFKNFINEAGLNCKSIRNGPKYIKALEAYQVECKSSYPYYMQFDHDTLQWSLVERGTINK